MSTKSMRIRRVMLGLLWLATAGSPAVYALAPPKANHVQPPPVASGRYRTRVLYDLRDKAFAHNRLPIRYDTLVTRDSVDVPQQYECGWKRIANPRPYRLYATGNIRLPALARGGYEAALTRWLQRLRRSDYRADRQNGGLLPAAGRPLVGSPLPGAAQGWA